MTQGDKIVQCYIPAFTRSVLSSIKIVVDDSFNEKFCSSPEDGYLFTCQHLKALCSAFQSDHNILLGLSCVSVSFDINKLSGEYKTAVHSNFYYTTLLHCGRGPVKLLTSRRKQINQLIVQSTEKSYE